MKDLVTLIQENPITTTVILVVIAAIILRAITNSKGLLRKIALHAVAKAEEAWGSNTGRIKFAEAFAYIKKKMPIVTFFITEEHLSKIIEEALVQLKEILATKEKKEKE